MTVTLQTARLCPPGPPAPGWLVLDGPQIIDTGPGRRRGDVTDLGDALVVPGFVDLQVNGLDDVDLARADPAGWARVGYRLLQHGTTAYCPTFVTAPLDAYRPALSAARAACDSSAPAATVLGVHLEGPFLGGAPGAHPVDLLRPADTAWLVGLLDTYQELIRLVTLAPEADPDFTATRLLAGRGVTVALGHSTASFDDVLAAAEAGATMVTHLFNGMAPLHHRAPGLAGAALTDDRLSASLIADLAHVHPAVLRLSIATKRSLALVSDAVAVAVSQNRVVPLTDDRGAVRLPDGTLVGSTLTLDQAVRNVVGLGVPVERAVEMAATIPAQVIGARDRGRLAPGTRADFVVLDPQSLAVRAVWLRGDRYDVGGLD